MLFPQLFLQAAVDFLHYRRVSFGPAACRCLRGQTFEMKQNNLTKTNRCGDFSAGERFPAMSAGAFRDFSGTDEKEAVGKIDQCITYMIEHIDQPMQVSTLAALANVSLSHFFALFKQRTGCPPMDYFTRLRMRRACRLLGSSSASVKEVAAALGYDDPFYFSRVFKSVNNVAPSKYRTARSSYANEPESRSPSLTLPAENPLVSEK
jgi:AraC-like DNA-binding protein